MSVEVMTPPPGGVLFPDAIEIENISTVAAARELITQATAQEWRLKRHKRFVADLGVVVARVIEYPVRFIDDPPFLDEPVIALGPVEDLPCSTDVEAVDHVIDMDHNPAMVKDPALVERALGLCAGCHVRAACLERSYTEPVLGPGLWGGLLREERKPEWERRSAVRQKKVAELYSTVATRLQGIISAYPDEQTQLDLRRAFAAHVEKFIASPDPESPNDDFNDKYELIAEVCLGSPLIKERAFLLLSRFPTAILDLWIKTALTGALPQYDRPKLAEAGEIAIASIPNRLLPAEELVIQTVTELTAGTFDYHEWQRNYAQDCQKSALAFLARIAEPIPPDADIQQLKELAAERLASLTSRMRDAAERARNILFDYYGLGTEPAANVDTIAEKYGGTTEQIMKQMKTQVGRLKKLLGRL